MSRLPNPGSDDGIWGDVLNDFLSVGHNSDGTLKLPGSINSAVQSVNSKTGPTVTLIPGDLGAATDSAVVHNTGNETVGGVKTFSSSPVVPAPTNGTDAANKAYVDSIVGGGGGETNTASNVGTGGVGVFKQKTGVDLEFKNVQAASSRVSVANNAGANTIDIDVNAANLTGIPQSAVTNLTTDLANKADDTSVVHKADYTAKGAILVGTAAGAYVSRTVGADDEILVADSSQASGVRWSAPAAQSTDNDIYALHWMEVGS